MVAPPRPLLAFSFFVHAAFPVSSAACLLLLGLPCGLLLLCVFVCACVCLRACSLSLSLCSVRASSSFSLFSSGPGGSWVSACVWVPLLSSGSHVAWPLPGLGLGSAAREPPVTSSISIYIHMYACMYLSHICMIYVHIYIWQRPINE